MDLVVLGDSLVGKRRTTPGKLLEAALSWKGKGCRAARRAARLVRAGVDSPMETRLRLLMVFAGLPEPTVNHIEYGADGERKRRFDLSYPDLLLIIELAVGITPKTTDSGLETSPGARSFKPMDGARSSSAPRTSMLTRT